MSKSSKGKSKSNKGKGKSSKGKTLVVYERCGEIIVCTPDQEKKTVQEYFLEGGRNIEAFDRSESTAVCITTVLERLW